MTLLLLGLSSYAAQFDETNLQGLWELTSCQGEYPLFTEDLWDEGYALSDFKYLYIGSITYGMRLPGMPGPIDADACGGWMYNPNDETALSLDNAFSFTDFIISNENKLHMLSPWGPFRFILETLNDKEMRFSSFDGKFHVVYKRVSDTSVNKIEISSSPESESHYGIDGMPVSPKEKGVHIVRKGNTASKKIIKPTPANL